MKICLVKFKYFPEGEIRNTLYFIYQTPILVLKTVFNRANKKQNVMEVSIQGRLIAQIFLQLQSFTFFLVNVVQDTHLHDLFSLFFSYGFTGSLQQYVYRAKVIY